MSKLKRKVYVLLGKESFLEPISGDRINEIGVINALMENYEVYYNGIKATKGDETFGVKGGEIHTPKPEQYDLIYIRGNKHVFLASPSPKLWVASPYDEECFQQADGIVCITKSWRDALASYQPEKRKYLGDIYPSDMKAPKVCLHFPQVIDDKLLQNVPVSQDNSEEGLSWLDSIKSLVRGNRKKPKVLRHFGPVRPTNYPYQLAHILEKKEYKLKIAAECFGAGKKMSLPNTIKNVPKVPKNEVKSKLVSSDAIWYNQNSDGNIAGSLKVLEAMAAGVPVLLPKYDARVEELGAEYPFFWELEEGSQITDLEQPDFENKLNDLITMSEEDREQLSEYLQERAKNFSKQKVAKTISEQLENFWRNYERK